jgi:hypothetical protein
MSRTVAERGTALVVALVVTMLVVAIGSAHLRTTAIESGIARNAVAAAEARHAADAAALTTRLWFEGPRGGAQQLRIEEPAILAELARAAWGSAGQRPLHRLRIAGVELLRERGRVIVEVEVRVERGREIVAGSRSRMVLERLPDGAGARYRVASLTRL